MKVKEQVMRWVFAETAAFSIAAVALICVFLFLNGLPFFTKYDLGAFLSGTTWKPANNIFGILPMIVGSLYVTGGALLFGAPVGILAGIYLARFCPKRLYSVLKPAVDLLAGIPSIVYGLFGMLFFVTQLHWGYSLIAGAFTLAIMVLPVIMRTTEEALIAVPDSYREGSFGLGAGKLRTVFTIVLPSAMPGILSGVILATGRIVGETAALIYTASSVAKIPTSVFSSTRTLAVHMYLLSNEGLYIGQTYGTAVVLLVLVLVINCLSGFLAGKLAKK